MCALRNIMQTYLCFYGLLMTWIESSLHPPLCQPPVLFLLFLLRTQIFPSDTDAALRISARTPAVHAGSSFHCLLFSSSKPQAAWQHNRCSANIPLWTRLMLQTSPNSIGKSPQKVSSPAPTLFSAQVSIFLPCRHPSNLKFYNFYISPPGIRRAKVILYFQSHTGFCSFFPWHI